MHQPVDNFGNVVDEAIELCYKPFFETMALYPEFKLSVHCSGWLLDVIRNNHPKLFETMHYLTLQGSIEWLSAGYYEPVLSAIPSVDRQAQIHKLNNYLKEHLGFKPKGLWLTERVWESSLVEDLSTCGIEYTVLDDYHFMSSGFDSKNMDGYYITEESGTELGLFPISKALRYALPFFSVEHSIETILASSHHQNSAAIIFDDAEKFGLWPKTHEWVYEKKWLQKFVEAVLSHEEIQTEHFSTYKKESPSLGLAYLNNTSYFEMGEWSLHANQTLALERLKHRVGDDYFNNLGVSFIKGGIWKNFLVKYNESNYLHKRMLHFSKQQSKLNKEALDNLYKLQTNDVLWHGVFGGLYLPNLRDNAYKYLLAIEKSLHVKKIKTKFFDIDKDGSNELMVRTKNLSVAFSSKHGGQMIEFGSLDRLFNWQNTLMRREEAYHDKIIHPQPIKHEESHSDDAIATIHNDSIEIDEDLKKSLIYDWHPKYSFIDHFSDAPFSLKSFGHVNFREIGDFANQPFEFQKKKNRFVRDGGIYLDKQYKAIMEKEYAFFDNSILLNTQFKSQYDAKLFYACEMNLHFAHPDKVTFNGSYVADGLTLEECDTIHIVDDFTNKVLLLKTNQKSRVFASKTCTVSQNEHGFEKVIQGISFIFTIVYSLEFEFNISLELADV